MRNSVIRAAILYGGFVALMTIALVLESEPLCLAGVAWITGGASILARDVARWSRGASIGLGLAPDETALFWFARVAGGIAGATALILAVAQMP